MDTFAQLFTEGLSQDADKLKWAALNDIKAYAKKYDGFVKDSKTEKGIILTFKTPKIAEQFKMDAGNKFGWGPTYKVDKKTVSIS